MSSSPPPVALRPGETLDRLSGAWWILQLARGHRYAADDVLTAAAGLEAAPGALRVLELCAGLGSVGLMVLQRLAPEARLVTLEVQQVSHALQRRTIALNDLTGRVVPLLGDLREPEHLASQAPFDLILANPPYLPPRSATPSPHPQRAAARLELHGDVFDLCRAVAPHLAPAGRFCLCYSARDPRPERAIAAAGLSLLARQDVRFRHDQPPMIALFTCAWQGERSDPPEISLRGPDGAWTEAWRRVRRRLEIEA